jgi:hypothetical protein
MLSSLKKSDLSQALEELATKEHADFEDVKHNLGDLAEGVKLLHGDLTKAPKDVTNALASFRADFNDLSQQQRAQHVAITRLERASQGAPSLVNNDATPQAARIGGSHQLHALLGLADERTPRLYKLNFLTYDGKGDPRPWLTRCNLFFLGQRTLDTDKTWVASYHLTDVDALWYGHLEEKIGRPTWPYFVARVSQHFAPHTRANPFGELISLRRTGSMAEYTKQFLQLLSHIHLSASRRSHLVMFVVI